MCMKKPLPVFEGWGRGSGWCLGLVWLVFGPWVGGLFWCGFGLVRGVGCLFIDCFIFCLVGYLFGVGGVVCYWSGVGWG